MPVLVSACLLGIRCRYDGSHNIDQKTIEIINKTFFIPICPEQLGGLSTPRDPSNIISGDGKDVLNGNAKVMSISGADVTECFINPSCGLATPYCQTYSGYGLGVTAAFFINHGIEIIEAG